MRNLLTYNIVGVLMLLSTPFFLAYSIISGSYAEHSLYLSYLSLLNTHHSALMISLAISPRFVINVIDFMIALCWIPFKWSPCVLFSFNRH